MSFAVLPPDHPDDLSPEPRTEGQHAKLSMLTLPSRRSAWALKVNDPGDYEGRHRRPRYAHAFPDGLVYWSDPAERWMRVDVFYPDEALS